MSPVQTKPCGEGACPRWTAKQSQTLLPRSAWHTACTGFATASQPNGVMGIPTSPLATGPSYYCQPKAWDRTRLVPALLGLIEQIQFMAIRNNAYEEVTEQVFLHYHS
ncbi:hypothetical protein ABH905_004892 [Pseudomonas frederiksbergensis]